MQKQEKIKVAQELVSIGKSNFGMGVLSGSSASVKELAHKINPSDLRHAGYPNFNHRVYGERHLYPIRSESDFKEVIELHSLIKVSILHIHLGASALQWAVCQRGRWNIP